MHWLWKISVYFTIINTMPWGAFNFEPVSILNIVYDLSLVYMFSILNVYIWIVSINEMIYSLRPMKNAILGFFSDILVVAWKDSYALNCLPHIVSFGMQFKFDHLIRQVIEIQSLELHSLWDFFKLKIALFMGWWGYFLSFVRCSYFNISVVYYP